MSENEDRYHDTILDLEAKLKKNVDLILKLGNSLQGMFMLGPKPLSVYDPQLKHGLGYPNPYTLKQAISQCPKLYLASSLSNSEIPLNVRDTEDTLDDASKSQHKMKGKINDPIAVANKQNCWTIDYKQINALYKDFVPQKELSAEQKYFPSSFIPSDKTPNATSSVPASMPSESPLIIQLDKMKSCFQTLSELIQKNCKRASIFYTSPEEIQLNDFCQDQVKPIVNELQFYFEFFRKLFQRDIKEMKDVFESTESELCEIKKQNDFLKDQLLEASLRHEVEIRINAATSVRRPMNKDSHVKNSVLANSKNSAKKVPVYVRKNNQIDKTSANVISNKENVIDVNVANAPKAKTLLSFSTNSRTAKSSDTTYVVLKTSFLRKLAHSKSLDTTSVVSNPKIDVEVLQKTSRHWLTLFESQPNVVWSPVNTTLIVHNKCSIVKPSGFVKKWVVKLPTCPCVSSSSVAGLGHNLFSVGQFCDGDLEVAFHSKTCYVRNLEGDDLLTRGCESNLYTISISSMAASSPVYLMSKATSTKSCSNIERITFVFTCERGKSKKASHPPKLVPSDHSKLELLHMDLCEPIRVASINGKKYILVIVDDYSRYTWVYFLHSKDETPEIIKKFHCSSSIEIT
ncbi:integrase, catalytic region, zinc finger, CCHC-type containing protein [Tanacetum coccineum]